MRPVRLLFAAGCIAGLLALSGIGSAQGEKTTCPVDGKLVEVGPKTRSVRVNDRKFHLCGADCLKAFAARPQKYVSAPVKCPVYTNRDAAVGDRRRILNNGLYYFCCDFCWDDFAREPEKYVRELSDPVTGEAFAPKPDTSSVQVDGQVYLFASDRTREQFEKDRERYVIRFGR